ncbi:hypothetical protein F4678DRAFT_484130 [Xylaria arbuscula]|nr:hypothetical protein F4678DRAFT_484130 [Xylaria arbuscula]
MLAEPFILQLPVELCEYIFVECRLSRKDLISLSLTCRAFATTTRHALSLALVVISRLKADRDAFLEIAQDPWRAKYVKEIIWEELRLERHGIEVVSLNSSEAELLDRAACDVNLFWAPKRDWDLSMRRYERRHNFKWLIRGMKKMANLKTIANRPMRGYRKFGYKGQDILAVQYASKLWNIKQHANLHLNAIGEVFYKSKCKVRGLNLSIGTLSCKYYYLDTHTFKHLTTLEICILTGHSTTTLYELTCFSNQIQTLRALRNLKLHFRRLGDTLPQDWIATLLQNLLNAAHWPRLASFHLVNGPRQSINHPDLLTEILANLGPQLHKLALDECGVTYGFLDRMRTEQKFPQLQSFVVRYRGRASRQRVAVAETRVLGFLRNEISDLQPATLTSAATPLYTHIEEPESLLSDPFLCHGFYHHPYNCT